MCAVTAWTKYDRHMNSLSLFLLSFIKVYCIYWGRKATRGEIWRLESINTNSCWHANCYLNSIQLQSQWLQCHRAITDFSIDITNEGSTGLIFHTICVDLAKVIYCGTPWFQWGWTCFALWELYGLVTSQYLL